MIVLRNFSENSEENDKKKEKQVYKAATGTTLIRGGIYLGSVLNNVKATSEKSPLFAENKSLRDKLKAEAEGRGIKIKDIENSINSRVFLKDKKVEAGKAASALAHELGHLESAEKGKIGKVAHRLIVPSKILSHSLVGMANGIDSGMRAERNKREGKKESKLNRHKSWALPVAASVPLLIAEGAASKRGYQMLKRAGASESYLKNAKTGLALAGSSYVAGTAGRALTGEGGRYLGKWAERKRYKFMNKDKDNHNNKD